MTLKEFFRQARAGRTWRVQEGLNPRCERVLVVRCTDGKCPLAAVTSGLWDISEAARALDIPKRLARKIANASDYPKSRNRAWLLKNLGVGSQESQP